MPGPEKLHAYFSETEEWRNKMKEMQQNWPELKLKNFLDGEDSNSLLSIDDDDRKKIVDNLEKINDPESLKRVASRFSKIANLLGDGNKNSLHRFVDKCVSMGCSEPIISDLENIEDSNLIVDIVDKFPESSNSALAKNFDGLINRLDGNKDDNATKCVDNLTKRCCENIKNRSLVLINLDKINSGDIVKNICKKIDSSTLDSDSIDPEKLLETMWKLSKRRDVVNSVYDVYEKMIKSTWDNWPSYRDKIKEQISRGDVNFVGDLTERLKKIIDEQQFRETSRMYE